MTVNILERKIVERMNPNLSQVSNQAWAYHRQTLK
jgi:hypothetical protein